MKGKQSSASAIESDKESRRAVLERLIQRVRGYQIRNQFLEAGEGPLGMSRTEVTVIIEFDTGADFSQAELASELRVEPILIRRTLKKLVARKFLQSSEHSLDGRRVKFELTNLGREALQQADRRFESNTQQTESLMSAAELKQFDIMIRTLAGGLGQPPARVRVHEHPLRAPMRQVTRALELVGSTPFFVSEVSPMEWHVVNDLTEVSTPLIARDLAKRYRIPKNTLSRTLTLLTDRGYIERTLRSVDKREQALSVTPEGRRFVRKKLGQITDRLENALEGVSTSDIDQFSALIGRAIGEMADVNEVVVQQEASIHSLRTESERIECREFAISQAVFQGKPWKISDVVMGERNFCYLLRQGSALGAVCEIRPKNKEWELINFVFIPALTEELIVTFVLTSVRLFRQTTGSRVVRSAIRLFPSRCKRKIFGELVNTDIGIIR